MKKPQKHKNKTGPKPLADEDKLQPFSLKIENSMIRDCHNISDQMGVKVAAVARTAMKKGIALIYKDGEVKPIKED